MAKNQWLIDQRSCWAAHADRGASGEDVNGGGSTVSRTQISFQNLELFWPNMFTHSAKNSKNYIHRILAYDRHHLWFIYNSIFKTDYLGALTSLWVLSRREPKGLESSDSLCSINWQQSKWRWCEQRRCERRQKSGCRERLWTERLLLLLYYSWQKLKKNCQ